MDKPGLWGNTPLISACSYGFQEVARALLAANADASVVNEKGAGALHFATAEGAQDLCRELLDAGAGPKGAANLYHRHLDGYFTLPPLAAAAQAGFPDLVRLLLDRKADVAEEALHGTALWCACRYGQPTCVQVLLAAGAGDVPCDGVACVEAACLPWGVKAERAQQTCAVLKILLEAENPADVNASGAPLVAVVNVGNEKAAQLLITHGSRVNTQAKDGRTALHAACEKQHSQVIELLVSHRADMNAVDDSGLTPVELARRSGKPELLALLGEAPGERTAGTGEAG